MSTSLKIILGREVPKKQLLSEFLDKFENRLNNATLDNVISEWKRYSATVNRHVRIVTTNDVSEGLAMDVDENGALILKLSDGSIKKIIYGDCFHN
jgi:BirA family biotin operon repressor/biotin-[acetyl-CoA-carboxylase] ligase